MNDYLLNAKISLLERKLNLKESIGFDPNDYPYQEHWDVLEKSDYESLMSKASEYPTLVGVFNSEGSKDYYRVTIFLHEGQYVIFLKEVDGVDFSFEFFEGYLEALESAQTQALILDICRKNRKRSK